MVRSITTSKIIRGYHLVFTQSFQNEIRTSRKSPISIQLKKEFPAQVFSEEEYQFLAGSINRLKKYISYTTHYCQSIVVKNAVFNLLLDISDKRRKEHGDSMHNATHKEVILERFKSLVNGHSNEHHSVNWYAEAMMISPDYLSKIIREFEGKSARDLINESIVNNAKFMMRQSDISIKEISEKLHFPDQSSFGRFFKTNTGQSPKDYRKNLADE
jgi:YesN/AraC family two-component response regulator